LAALLVVVRGLLESASQLSKTVGRVSRQVTEDWAKQATSALEQVIAARRVDDMNRRLAAREEEAAKEPEGLTVEYGFDEPLLTSAVGSGAQSEASRP